MSRNKRKRNSEGQNRSQTCGTKQQPKEGTLNSAQQEQVFQGAAEREGLQSFKEYEMLRAEILQYLEEYQSVRNMMYLATAAILGLNSMMFQNYYLFLLPLVVILPSYIIFYNYWKSVSCASTYIQVFLDNEDVQEIYHWELRHRYFSELHKENKKLAADKLRGLDMHCHQIPYLFCSCLCLVLYWINMLQRYISPYVRGTLEKTWSVCADAIRLHFFTAEGRGLVTTWCALSDVILGGILIIVLLYIFVIYWSIDDVKLTAVWERVKNLDIQQEEELREKLGLHTRKNSSK